MLTGIKVMRNKEIMIHFHQMVNPMYEKQQVLSKENQQLSSLRDWLLPMLMNGQVKVGDSAIADALDGMMAAEGRTKYIVKQ
jgi:type I restriction enzyme S subunit